jgi:hypothetical protein
VSGHGDTPTVTPNEAKFSAGAAAENVSAGVSVNGSAGRERVCVRPRHKRAKAKPLAENIPGLQMSVDDEELFDLVFAGRVGVHKNGSRQKKRGITYDYRSHYRALRLNSGDREVLAFGTPERLSEKLAQLGIRVCFEHARPILTVGANCQKCSAGQSPEVRASAPK